VDFHPFSIFRYQSDVSIKTLVEVVQAVFKGLLEVAGPVDVHEYLVRALGSQV